MPLLASNASINRASCRCSHASAMLPCLTKVIEILYSKQLDRNDVPYVLGLLPSTVGRFAISILWKGVYSRRDQE
jgi:hypothetical protein